MNTEIARRALAACVIASLLAPAARASAEDKPKDPAAAEVLYHRGRALVGEGNWAEGCPKFQASMELNPAPSTLINIAMCHEHEGKLGQAIADYRRALQLNQDTLGSKRKKDLEKVATDGIAALEPRLARVRVVLKERPEGTRVTRDGQELPLPTLGEEIPLDPGEHAFEAWAPGFRKADKQVKLAEGEAATVELVLVPAPPGEDKAPPPPPPMGKAKEKDKPSSGGVPAWAFVAGGLGLAAVGGGIAFRFDQMAAEDRLLAKCGPELRCPPGIEYDWQSDNARKNRDFYLFVGLTAAGAVGIGAAVVGIVRGVGKKNAQAQVPIVAPFIGRGEGGAIVQGAF